MSRLVKNKRTRGQEPLLRTPTCLGSLSASLGKAKQSVSIKDSLATPLVIPRSTRIHRFLEVVHARRCATRPDLAHCLSIRKKPPNEERYSSLSCARSAGRSQPASWQFFWAVLILDHPILSESTELSCVLVVIRNPGLLSSAERTVDCRVLSSLLFRSPPANTSRQSAWVSLRVLLSGLSRPVWLTDPQVSRAPVFAFFGAIFVRNAAIDTTRIFASRQRR